MKKEIVWNLKGLKELIIFGITLKKIICICLLLLSLILSSIFLTGEYGWIYFVVILITIVVSYNLLIKDD